MATVAPFEIQLYGEIGFENEAKTVIAQINSAKDRPIDLHINSPGGSVFDGYAIYNALLNHKPGVNVYVDGLAASIASYIAMAGSKIYMADNALLMLHNPSTMAGGDASDLRKQADILEKIESSLVDAYARRSGLPAQAIIEMLDEETWLDADTALAFGFVDEITQPLKLAASFDKTVLSQFKNCPEHLLKMATENQPVIPSESEGPSNQPQVPAVPPVESEAKPSIFSRVSAMLKEKSDLVALVSKHECELKAKDETIATCKSEIANLQDQVAASLGIIADYKKAEEDLKNAVASLEAEKTTVSEEAVNVVASMGFDKTKLPAPLDADALAAATEPQTEEAWMEKVAAIKDLSERQKFLRENEIKIWACRMAARNAANNKTAVNPSTKPPR